MRLMADTLHYGLVGYPLGHSFSAGYFAEKFAREEIDATYANFAIPHIQDLPQIIATEGEALRGFNVTIPYKEAILPYLHEVSAVAREIGAVNCVAVSWKEGRYRLKGYNTDVIGFAEDIAPHLSGHQQALVLGTGGAAKAVVVALQQLGLSVTLVSRTPQMGVLTYDTLSDEVMAAHTVIVNTTPCGMYPKVEDCPPIPYERLTPSHLLYDVVYNPEVTRFLALGRAQGAQVLGGLGMLHGQAEAAWSIWQGTLEQK